MAFLSHFFPTTRWRLAALVCLAALHGAAFAQLPVAKLTSLFPEGARFGSSIEVNITGADLEDLRGAVFNHPGITGVVSTASQTLKVEVATNVPVGPYEMRVVGRFGVSNPRIFVVGQWPEALKSETNSTAESAQSISLPATINGQASVSADDYYRFNLSKDQRVLIECLATSLDSKMSPALTLYDGAGRELERSRNEDLLDFRASSSGDYVLKLHDISYRGGANFFYRLTISFGPHIDFVWPPSGMVESTGKFTIFGRNLPGSTPATNQWADGKMLEQLPVEIEIPKRAHGEVQGIHRIADSAAQGFYYRLSTTGGVSNPYFLSFATAPVVPEQEPNDLPSVAQQVSLPCEYVGQFYPRGDSDWITFQARKGDVYWVEVFSQRLGFSTAPFALVQRVTTNSTGGEKVSDVQELYDYDTNIGGVEFNTAARDPVWRFEVQETGTYRIEIRDRFRSTQDDARRIYRLSLRKEKPDFQIVAVPQAGPPANKDKKEATLWSSLIRRGETTPIKVLLFRRDNFSGEVEISVDALPRGVTCPPTLIPPGASTAYLMISAADDAPNWAGPLKIVGRGKVGEFDIAHEACGGTIVWQVEDYSVEGIRARLSSEPVIAVSGAETAPISIRPEQSLVEAAPSTKISIPLKILRPEGFGGAFKLKIGGVKELDSLKEIDIDGKATNANFEIDLSQAKLEPGRHTIYFQGQVTGKYKKYSLAEEKVIEDEKKLVIKDAEKELSALGKEDKNRAVPEAKKQKAEKELKAFTQLNQSRDVTFTVWSSPVVVKVRPVAVSAAKP